MLILSPARGKTFVLDTDASEVSIGAELSQLQEGKVRVIAYASHVLQPAQRRYCVTRKELLAVVKFCRQFRHFLLGQPFIVRTDHSSLVWLWRFRHLEGQLARWVEELAQYDMKIIHRSGKHHNNADGLSRIPDPEFSCDCYSAGRDLDSLPCGGCAFCRRTHEQWARFPDDVDDVVPLAMHRLLPVAPKSPEIRQVSATPPDRNPQTSPCSSPNWARGYSNQ